MIDSEVIINKGNNEILTKLKSLFDSNKYSSFIMAVSYVKFHAFIPLIEKVMKMKNGRIVVTTDGYVTSPEMIRWLMNKFENGSNHKARIFVPSEANAGFHVKSYSFSNDEQTLMFVGSSNISNTAFAINYEMNILTTHKNGDPAVTMFENEFEKIFNISRKVDDAFILEYELEFRKKALLDAKQISINPDNFINKMQRNALSQLELIRNREKGTRAIQVAATGSGKTRLAALDIINHIILNKSQISGDLLFVTINKTLIEQSIKSLLQVIEFKKTELVGIKIVWNELDSGKKIDELIKSNDGFVIHFVTHKLSIDLVNNNHINNDFFDYILIDEAHHTSANGQIDQTNIFKVANKFKPSFLLGLTATPERMDGYNMIANVFDSTIVSQYDMEEAIEDSLISPFVYYLIDKEAFKDGFIEYSSNLLMESFNVKIRKQIESVIEKYPYDGQKLKAIAFVNNGGTKNVLSNVTGYFDGVNSKYRAAYINGSTSNNERNKIFESLSSDDVDTINIIFSDGTLTEGIDIPSINAVFLFRTTKSIIRFKQQIGRGLRRDPKNPQSYLSVYDFASALDREYFALVKMFATKYGEKQSKENVSKGVKNGFENFNFVFDKLTHKDVFDYLNENIKNLAFEDEDTMIIDQIIEHKEDFKLHLSSNKKYFVGGYIKLREFDNMSQYMDVSDLVNSKHYYTNLFPEIKKMFNDVHNQEKLSFAFEMLLKSTFANESENDFNKLLDFIKGKAISQFESNYINGILLSKKVAKKDGTQTIFYWDELEPLLNNFKKGNSDGYERIKELQEQIAVQTKDGYVLNPILLANLMFKKLLDELEIYIMSKTNVGNIEMFIMEKKQGNYFRYHQLASNYNMSPMTFKTSTQTIIENLNLIVIKPKFPSGHRFPNEILNDYTEFKYYFKTGTKDEDIASVFMKSTFDVYISFKASKNVSASAKMIYLGNTIPVDWKSEFNKSENITDKYVILKFEEKLSESTIKEIEKHIDKDID